MKSPSFKAFNDEQHQCIGHKEGDWIIFTCPICRDYERRINWKTHQVKVKKGSSMATHAGSHAPLKSSVKSFSVN